MAVIQLWKILLPLVVAVVVVINKHQTAVVQAVGRHLDKQVVQHLHKVKEIKVEIFLSTVVKQAQVAEARVQRVRILVTVTMVVQVVQV